MFRASHDVSVLVIQGMEGREVIVGIAIDESVEVVEVGTDRTFDCVEFFIDGADVRCGTVNFA